MLCMEKKEKDHGNQIVLPIFLFFDDYEVGNALGSHSGIHKLGAVYIYQFLVYLLIFNLL